jgi:group II intron reverse transcriptase/maturase
MQKADLVLTMLNRKERRDNNFKYRRLYRNLFNPGFYLRAYAKIYSKEGNMTKGVDGKTIDGFGKRSINKIIQLIKTETYKPLPVRRKYIPKKNKNEKRPLGIPAILDKLVQEVLRQILEAIYEPAFSNNSHGFRPNKSCHTALMQIKDHCMGSSWAIEGDIKGFFDNIDHDILIGILRRKIEDERFLNLIRKFLKAGIMEEGKIRNPTNGTPQGGIVSPILANIYLNELDSYVVQLQKKTEAGNKRKRNNEYHRISMNRLYRIKQGNHKEAKDLLKIMYNMQSKDPMDKNFKRLCYTRYADDFVIFIHGGKEYAQEIKQNLAQFLTDKLKLNLNIDKTLITNILTDKAKFLGYEIAKAKNDSKMTVNSYGIKKRSINGSIQLLIPKQNINEKIKKFTKNGKPTHMKDRLYLPIHDLIGKYNAEIRGLYNYYNLAMNVGKRLTIFRHYHYMSLVRTISVKLKISEKKVFKKYTVPVKRKSGTGTRNIIGIEYQSRNGKKQLTYFNQSLKRITTPTLNLKTPDQFNPAIKSEIIRRILKGECELCNGKIGIDDCEVHHIRKLKTMIERYNHKKGNIPKWINLMIKMRRKTLVVCKHCHSSIHKNPF